MSNTFNSADYSSKKHLNYISQVTINGKSFECVIHTNNPFKYFYHKIKGNLRLARGKSYHYEG